MFRYGSLCFLVVLFLSHVSSAQQAKKDPTRPLGATGSGVFVEKLTLQAIFYGKGRKEAIINGALVKEGAYVSGKKVVKIQPKKVIYQVNNEFAVLELRQSIFNR